MTACRFELVDDAVIAEGVQFSDGTVVLHWVAGRPSTVVYGEHGIETVLADYVRPNTTKFAWL